MTTSTLNGDHMATLDGDHMATPKTKNEKLTHEDEDLASYSDPFSLLDYGLRQESFAKRRAVCLSVCSPRTMRTT